MTRHHPRVNRFASKRLALHVAALRFATKQGQKAANDLEVAAVEYTAKLMERAIAEQGMKRK